MCIICNCTIGNDQEVYANVEKAEAFLAAFERSRRAMQEAADAMLAVSKIVTADDRKRYDAVHKAMVHQIRGWNRLEQKREHETPPAS